MTAPLHAKTAKTTFRRERRKESRPLELVNAALELFVGKGYSATRVEEIAARAGVSKGTLFLYFSSKEDLFKAVIRENIVNLFPAWNEEFNNFQGSSSEMLHYAMDSWWLNLGKTPASGIVKLVFSEAQNFPEVAAYYQEEVFEPGAKLISNILQRGIDRDEFSSMDTSKSVLSIISAMIFLMMWKHSIGACTTTSIKIDPQEFMHLHVDMLLNGISLRNAR
jgi:TetR/AcrR family transcriptional regulator